MTWRGAPVQLTTTEFNLLVALLQFGDRVATRDQLSRNVLGRPWESYDRSIDVHINNLRQKLLNASEGGLEIETVRGVGYRAKARPCWISSSPVNGLVMGITTPTRRVSFFRWRL